MSPLVPIGAVTAIVGLGVGSVTGLIAAGKKSDLEAGCPDGQCPPGQHDTLDGAKTLGNVSTVGFLVGGAGVVLTIVGFVSSAKQSGGAQKPGVSPWVGLGSAGVSGAF